EKYKTLLLIYLILKSFKNIQNLLVIHLRIEAAVPFHRNTVAYNVFSFEGTHYLVDFVIAGNHKDTVGSFHFKDILYKGGTCNNEQFIPIFLSVFFQLSKDAFPAGFTLYPCLSRISRAVKTPHAVWSQKN